MIDPSPVMDLIEAFRRSKVMFVAVSMGLFDRLGHGPLSAADLADEGVDTAAMERLLDACTSLGLLEKNERLYANSEMASRYLRRDSSHTLAGYILYSNQVLYPMWSNLEDAVREGSNRWRQTFGFEGDLFSHFFKTPASQRDFLMGMHGLGGLSSPAVAAAFDLGAFEHMVDIGGATGHLATAARRRYPKLRATVFDLPSVIAFAEKQATAPGVELIAGDFFADPLPEADLYAMGRILHDWSDEKVRLLLGKVCASLPVGGGLLIAERLLDEDGAGPVSALMQSMNMLVCTEGRERSFPEYRALLEEAGFTNVRARPTGTLLDTILALKK